MSFSTPELLITATWRYVAVKGSQSKADTSKKEGLALILGKHPSFLGLFDRHRGTFIRS